MDAKAQPQLPRVMVMVIGAAALVLTRTPALSQSPTAQKAAGELRPGISGSVGTTDEAPIVPYSNKLVRVRTASPILAGHPEFVAPLKETRRFLGVPLVVDERPTLAVRAWRYSYNARGIVEIPNELDGRKTAFIVVHPWGIDDGHGWQTPSPAGVAFLSTPEKNAIYHRHLLKVLNPFLDAVRSQVLVVGYSLPGKEDPIRRELYRSPRTDTPRVNRKSEMRHLQEVLRNFRYTGQSLPDSFPIAKGKEARMYFETVKGLDASERHNTAGFWELPVPLASALRAVDEDVVFYDEHGYGELRTYLRHRNITNVLLAGYTADSCLRSSTAGYENLRKDFNVFIVGDATLANFPAQDSPRTATTTALANASLDNLLTETAWIRAIIQGR